MFNFVVNGEIELRILEVRNAEEVFKQIDKNREYLSKWLPWAKDSNLENTKEFIQTELNRFAKNKGFTCGIFYKNVFVGCIGIHEIDWNNKKTSIGYWIGEDFQGRGIMTEAVKSIINYSFKVLVINRIEIRACTENLKSRAIPERLGFKHEGTVRQAELNNKHFYDHEIYGLIAGEWTEKEQ
jgi:ribosomal-protein-serine acetyltransferase